MDKIRLDEVVTLQNGYAFKSKDFLESGIPVIKIKNVKPDGLTLHKLDFIAKEMITDKLKKYIIPDDSILVTLSGNRYGGNPETWVGKACYYNTNNTMLLNQRVASLTSKDSEVLNTRWLAYLLGSWKYQEKFVLMSNSSGGQANISPSDVLSLEINLPSLQEQKAIAEVLSSLDDKIELLQKQNETLEALAQTLFRQWFIEEADDSWEVALIGDKLKTVLGGTPSKQVEEYWDGDVPWINSGMVNEFRVYKSSRNITVLGFNKSSTKLMPVGTTVVAITGATLGQISLLEIECCANQSVVGIIGNEEIPFWYVHLWITHMMPEIMLNETGGAQNHINKNDINSTKLVVPTKSYLNHKEDTFVSLYKKISLNVMEIETLRTTRDLLPKDSLISNWLTARK